MDSLPPIVDVSRCKCSKRQCEQRREPFGEAANDPQYQSGEAQGLGPHRPFWGLLRADRSPTVVVRQVRMLPLLLLLVQGLQIMDDLLLFRLKLLLALDQVA